VITAGPEVQITPAWVGLRPGAPARSSYHPFEAGSNPFRSNRHWSVV